MAVSSAAKATVERANTKNADPRVEKDSFFSIDFPSFTLRFLWASS